MYYENRKEKILGGLKDTVITIVLIAGIVFGLDLFFKKQDCVTGKQPGTIKYRVYYTPDNIKEYQVLNVYGYNVYSSRGSNSISVVKGNVSTWIPILKHVALSEVAVETTAPVEFLGFWQ